MFLNFFAVFIGGGIGCLLRYVIGLFCSDYISCDLPVATFFVNIVSCFIIGVAIAFFLNSVDINPAYKVSVIAGFCGGLSTFSAFSLEVVKMLENNNYLTAVLYVIFSIVICLSFTFIGFKLGNKFFS